MWTTYGSIGDSGDTGDTGDDGEDGTGFQFIWRRTNSSTVPATPASDTDNDDDEPTDWDRVPQAIDAGEAYIYISTRTGMTGSWSVWSTPVLWAQYVTAGGIGSKLMRTELALRNSKLKDDVDDLLLNYKPTSRKIAQRRNQYIAHSQGRNKRNPNSQLYAVDIDNFINSIVDTFRELGGFLQSTDYVFDHVRESRKRETTKVMEVLQED